MQLYSNSEMCLMKILRYKIKGFLFYCFGSFLCFVLLFETGAYASQLPGIQR